MREVRLVIIDDHPLLRFGLRDLLSAVPEIEVVGEAANGAQAIELIEEMKPDIAIVDVDMPLVDGIELVKLLRKRNKDVEVVFLTIHKDRSLLRSLPRLGVRGYVLKESATDEIIDCVRSVANGERYVSSKLEFDVASPEVVLPDSVDSLTIGELRVLLLISHSRTNREIADELRVSVRTVETHRYNICAKLALSGTHSLLKFAVQNKSRIAHAASLRETT